MGWPSSIDLNYIEAIECERIEIEREYERKMFVRSLSADEYCDVLEAE